MSEESNLTATGHRLSDLRRFVQRYADGSGITVATLFLLGLRAYPCDCKSDECEGFQMLSGDARASYEYATMLGKYPLQLSAEELKTAHEAADSTRMVTK